MAKKKIIQEEVESVVEDSAAAETLHAGSRPVDDPKSRYETLSAMIGAAATMRDEDLTKWYDQMIASTTGKELSKNIPDGAAASNASTLNMKPSDASARQEETDVTQVLKQAAKEDLTKILGEQEGLSEEFKTKTATLFESALEARLNVEKAKLEEEAIEIIEAEVNEAVEAIAEKLDEYLDYTAEKWMEDNEVAVESSLRNEITEEFIGGLKDLFAEHYIDIPEDKVDVVEQLSKTVDDLETRMNELISENASLKEIAEQASKKDITEEVAKGLTMVEAEKLREMAKTIETDDAEEFKAKLTTIKESSFVKTDKKSVLTEQLEEVSDDNLPPEQTKFTDPNIRNYVQAISRTARR